MRPSLAKPKGMMMRKTWKCKPTLIAAAALSMAGAYGALRSESDGGHSRSSERSVSRPAPITRPAASPHVVRASSLALLSLIVALLSPAAHALHIGHPPKWGGDGAKAWEHGKKEAHRGAVNTVEAVEIAAKTPGRMVKGYWEEAEAAVEQVRDGKLLKAVGTLYAAPVKVPEHVALRAASESSALRMVFQAAAEAAVPGGGGAAFAIWYTYRWTDDLGRADFGKALKAGAITYAAGKASKAVDVKADQVAKGAVGVASKALARGVVSGAAVGAAGGKARDGFLIGASGSLIADGIEAYSGHAPSRYPATKGAVPKGNLKNAADCAKIPECKVIATKEAARNSDVARNNVGTATLRPGKDGWVSFSEGSPFSRFLSKVSGINSMAHFHDTLSTHWNLGPGLLQLTIFPAFVATYAGFGAYSDQGILVAGVERK